MQPIRVSFKATKRNPSGGVSPMYVDYEGQGDLVSIETNGDYPSGIVVSDDGDFYVVRLSDLKRITIGE